MDKKVKKAAFTLEATIVMPTILILLCAVLFAFQLLYQHVVLVYAASYGASRGAMLWDYETNQTDFITGSVGQKNLKNGKPDIYYNLRHLSGDSNKTNAIKNETEKIISSLSIFGNSADVHVSFNSNLLGSSITVNVKQNVSVPFEAVLKYFNDGDMSLKAQSTSSLYDPDEFIRNADYAYELACSIIDKVKGSLGKIMNKTQ